MRILAALCSINNTIDNEPKIIHFPSTQYLVQNSVPLHCSCRDIKKRKIFPYFSSVEWCEREVQVRIATRFLLLFFFTSFFERNILNTSTIEHIVRLKAYAQVQWMCKFSIELLWNMFRSLELHIKELLNGDGVHVHRLGNDWANTKGNFKWHNCTQNCMDFRRKCVLCERRFHGNAIRKRVRIQKHSAKTISVDEWTCQMGTNAIYQQHAISFDTSIFRFDKKQFIWHIRWQTTKHIQKYDEKNMIDWMEHVYCCKESISFEKCYKEEEKKLNEN